ncbi:hypothetical protein [Aeromicrobium wangtongii]|uniref:hypothetical protein n=1 Tax=Aeromicrobium wangtongii TaxID=2969247 RepID=UPI002017D487|nr:hypothetical protein [Aeromicrobium wangtongii]MCL3818334.1 hypothetical protein [Aeromicrobium wangtongii]
MKTRALATAALSTALLLGVAACGSDDAEPKSATAKTSATPEAVPTPTGTPAQYAVELASAQRAAEQNPSAEDILFKALGSLEKFAADKGDYPKDLAEAQSAARLPAGSELTAYERGEFAVDLAVTTPNGSASLDGETAKVTKSDPVRVEAKNRADLLDAALKFASYLEAYISYDKPPTSDEAAQAGFVTYLEAPSADVVKVRFSQVKISGEGDFSFMAYSPDVADGEKVVVYDAKSVAKVSKNISAEKAAK